MITLSFYVSRASDGSPYPNSNLLLPDSCVLNPMCRFAVEGGGGELSLSVSQAVCKHDPDFDTPQKKHRHGATSRIMYSGPSCFLHGIHFEPGQSVF